MAEKNGLVYKVAISLIDVAIFDNFYDAFKDFWTRILTIIKEGTSFRFIETACWIERCNKATKIPMFIYDARDLAFDIGLLKENPEPKQPPIINDQPTVDGWEEIVRQRFVDTARSMAASNLDFQALLDDMEKLAEALDDKEVADEIHNATATMEKTKREYLSEIDRVLEQA